MPWSVERKRRYYRDHPEKKAGDNLRLRHGMYAEDFVAMKAAQDGCCYLCGDALPERTKLVHIDHDHTCTCGRGSCSACRRGLACGKCNMLIGLVGDDPERLERIAANLRIAASASRARIAETPIQDALIAMEGMPL